MWQQSGFCVVNLWYKKYIFSVAKIHTTLDCKIRGCTSIGCATIGCTRVGCTTISCSLKKII